MLEVDKMASSYHWLVGLVKMSFVNVDYLNPIRILTGLGVAAFTTALTKAIRSKLNGEKVIPVTLQQRSVKYPLQLVDKEQLSPNTWRFRFKLPTPDHILGLQTGQHVHVVALVNGEILSRPYTPISSYDDQGLVDFIIKVYFKKNHTFTGGKMSQYLHNLSLGDFVDFQGPCGQMHYNGCGHFTVAEDKETTREVSGVKKVGMIAGGTGITPMLQLARQVLKDPKDNLELWLLFANQTENDVLMRDELETLETLHPTQFRVWFTVDKTNGWYFSEGHVDEAMMRAHLPPPADDTLILMCGPQAMIDSACTPNLDKIGYTKQQRFIF